MTDRNFELTRKMGVYDVLQRTSDGYFDASVLLQQWNSRNLDNKKQMVEFLRLKQTKELIEELTKPENEKNQSPNNQTVTVVKTIKGKTLKNGGKTPDKVWMHPYLFIDFAMWLNSRFKVEVLKFVYDNLIELRNVVADSYRDWGSKLATVGAKNPEDFARVQRCMNYAVFNEHTDGIRNNATTEQLQQMREIETQIVNLIDFGMISTLEDVRKYLQKVWQKNYPKPF